MVVQVICEVIYDTHAYIYIYVRLYIREVVQVIYEDLHVCPESS